MHVSFAQPHLKTKHERTPMLKVSQTQKIYGNEASYNPKKIV
jgi:hypothetical protein